ncbi:helix-turn-helix transcriptional regulator [Bradyrhizobium diazoefficiens]|uniref:helix-turn-helix transcriptional regulator n=1 Tax=Bradyrhizobium diazoefficiens TaxID=1355477 RepID=UPI0027146612|nr:AlpA family phage regulatory protein [Bradyrhizobium diazoefficiens]WLC16276.1 AlpA family phage regulatory protein [Bradyrhizobium diazoefficiens]
MNTADCKPKNGAASLSGLRRLNSIIGPGNPIPVSRATWWAGIKSGRFPAPLSLGGRLRVWREEDIRKLIEEGVPRAGMATKSGDKS